MSRSARTVVKGLSKHSTGKTSPLRLCVFTVATIAILGTARLGKAETASDTGSLRSIRPSAVQTGGAFDGLLEDVHRRLGPEADRAAQLVRPQELREEGERLMQAGRGDLAVAKLESASSKATHLLLNLLFFPKYVVTKYESDFTDGAELVGVLARGTEDETRRIVIRMNIRKVSAKEEASILKRGRRGE